MMSILRANYDVLQRDMPDFLQKLEQADLETEDIHIEASVAKDGNSMDILTVSGVQHMMQSSYRPIEEAKRFVKQYDELKPDSCILFLGFGNGYIARELMRHEDAQFVFYEPSLAYFAYVLQQYDISDLLAAENIHIYVHGVNDQQLTYHMYRYVHALNWPVFYLEALPKYQQIFSEEMNQLAVVYEESRQHARLNYDVDIRFSELYLYNAIHNLEFIYQGSSLCEYDGILKPEIPVIIVSAGPSLEKNVAKLRQYRNQAFIMCVDRAAPVLAREGILPHAFVTVDAAKEEFLFEAPGVSQVPWFAYTTSNYKALKKLENPKLIFASTIYAYGYDLFQHVGSDIFTLANGGSVATVAVNIAMHLGSQKIILIGQDLALTGDKVHAGEQAVDLHKEGYALLQVPGFYGETVTTREDFKSYIDWYEAFVAQHPETTFVNCTEGGAFLSGMQHMSLDAAMQEYGIEELDGDRIMASVADLMDEEKQKLLCHDFQELYRYFQDVKHEVAGVIPKVKRGITIIKQKGIQSMELSTIEKQMEHFQQMYDGYSGRSILDLNIAKEIQEALIDVHFHEEDPKKELLRLYKKMLAYFEGIESAVNQAIPMLEEVFEILGLD